MASQAEPHDITGLLERHREGDVEALDHLIELDQDTRSVVGDLIGDLQVASHAGGATENTVPANARADIEKVESLAGVPIDIISTGPDRCETIIRRDLFQV